MFLKMFLNVVILGGSMGNYLGIDIGTSGTKAVCFNNKGEILGDATADYPLYNPKPMYAEQDPLDWLAAVTKVIKKITEMGITIEGIGLSGQMHGLVLLDDDDNVLRNSIIWCDNRCNNEVEEIKSILGNDFVKSITGNDVHQAFTLAKLLWVKNNEPDIFSKINKVCLPKDYIRYMLTNEFKTEYSDASGMQMLDIKKKKYALSILEPLKIDVNWLPQLIESVDISGYIKPELAAKLGVSNSCFIVGGAGDQAAAAIGNGILSKGQASIVLGSSGVVFTPIEKDDISSDLKVQVFMHAVKDMYHVMGVTNGCGLSYKWYKENIGIDDYEKLNDEAGKVLNNDLIYLPYLNGERTPHLDPYATGTFIGIRQNTTKANLTRAILEGVAYSLKDCFSVLPDMDYHVRISGGGAKGVLWRSIIASVLNFPIERIKQSEAGALGVAILAMVANNEYESIASASENILTPLDVENPNQELVTLYTKGYEFYKNAYLSLKNYYKFVNGGE